MVCDTLRSWIRGLVTPICFQVLFSGGGVILVVFISTSSAALGGLAILGSTNGVRRRDRGLLPLKRRV